MPAIVKFPAVVEEALGRLGPLFPNEPERRHVAEGARLKSCNNYRIFVPFADNRYDSVFEFSDGGSIDVSKIDQQKRK